MSVDATNTKTRRVGICIPSDLYEAGAMAAKGERRSFSNYIALLIEKSVSQVNGNGKKSVAKKFR
jgi:predicted CopG family antitoxin